MTTATTNRSLVYCPGCQYYQQSISRCEAFEDPDKTLTRWPVCPVREHDEWRKHVGLPPMRSEE